MDKTAAHIHQARNTPKVASAGAPRVRREHEPPVAPGIGDDRLLTANDVAALLAVPESWVREATRDGRLPHLKLGRYRRYQRPAIQAYLRAQQGGPDLLNRPV